MYTGLTTEDDEFVREIPRWVVTLDDGVSVYQDDGRPGAEPSSAWLRLREHCRLNGRHVVAMRLQFRSHVVDLPPGMPGYYFRKAAAAVWGGGDSETHDIFVAGHMGDGCVHVTWWKVPELTEVLRECRNPGPDDPSLIAKT